MQLKRALIVVEKRDCQDGSYAAFDLWNIEGSLRYTGMVESIDVLYYSEEGNGKESHNEWLINYCIRNKPDVILLSLQSMVSQKEKISPESLGIITHIMGIPTVMFWWSIYADSIADMLERYLHSVTLNVIGDADASSHKAISTEGTSYVYNLIPFNDSLFNLPDSIRDIPIGFLGSLVPFRCQWIEGLKKFGISIYTSGGQLVDGDTSFSTGKIPPLWLPYEEYLELTSRMKIVLNFSSGMSPMFIPATSFIGQAERAFARFVAQSKGGLSVLVKKPTRLKHIIPALKNVSSVVLKKPREMTRARVSEALWCRTLLLEENNPITSVYLEPYIDYVPFSTLKDLVDKIRYYLENDRERDRIRMHGRATMEEYYNARMYWENLFEAVGMPSDNEFHHLSGEVWNKAHFNHWYSSNKQFI